jgi:hypothetical protein
VVLGDRGYDHDKYRPLVGIHEAFPGLAVCLITHRQVQRLCQNRILKRSVKAA